MSSHFSTVGQIRSARPGLQPVVAALPTSTAVSVSASSMRSARPVLPVRPDRIPPQAKEAFRAAPISSHLAVRPADHPLEAEADRMAAQVSNTGPGTSAQAEPAAQHRHADGEPSARTASLLESPLTVQQAFNSPGKPLDSATRAYMEPRFGVNLAGVRVHTGADSAAAARSVEANAYTVGQDIFFAAGRYSPQSSEGRRLLAHELSHTVQQSGGSKAKRLSSAARGIYRDPAPGAKPTQGTTADTETQKPKTEQVTVPVPPALLQHLQLTPPSLLAPPQQPSILSPGGYALGHPGPSLFQPPSQYSPTSPSILPPPALYPPLLNPQAGQSPLGPNTPSSPALSPAPAAGGSATPAIPPKAPDSVSLWSSGPFSIKARFGFPDLSKDVKPGDPPSALQQSIQKTEVMNFMFTGAKPSAYNLDPGKLVGGIWGIVTQLDPALTSKIAASLSSKPTAGPTYSLDATILFSPGSGSGPTATKTSGGGGATFTVSF